jgi:hypothetical protein
MSPAFAFHNAAFAADRETNPLAKLFTREIAAVTGGAYSHVEFWLSGPTNAAVCFSSREPSGTGFSTIDLSNPAEWTIVDIPVIFDSWTMTKAVWFCKGSDGRAYDGVGIVGIGTGQARVHDPFARFCSEMCAEIGQEVFDLAPLRGKNAWQIAPSGRPRGGFGLYELLTT